MLSFYLAVALAFAEEEEAKPVLPPVVLTEQHRATCKLGVGDSFPELQLPFLSGKKSALTALPGKPLVVLFWTAEKLYAREQFENLQRELAAPYGERVRIAAVHVGEPPEEIAKQETEGVMSLVDADGAAFAKLASEKLPRTYVVDGSGKIRWFDIEYSRSTRRELKAALDYLLEE